MAKINDLLSISRKRKLTVADFEKQATDLYDLGDLSPESKQFYNGFLRAIQLLRRHKLLKE